MDTHGRLGPFSTLLSLLDSHDHSERSFAGPAALVERGAFQGGGKEVVDRSSNGLRACDKALEMMRAGADTLDAVVAGVNIRKMIRKTTRSAMAVFRTSEGIVELDASVMHGPTSRCGRSPRFAISRTLRNWQSW